MRAAFYFLSWNVSGILTKETQNNDFGSGLPHRLWTRVYRGWGDRSGWGYVYLGLLLSSGPEQPWQGFAAFQLLNVSKRFVVVGDLLEQSLYRVYVSFAQQRCCWLSSTSIFFKSVHLSLKWDVQIYLVVLLWYFANNSPFHNYRRRHIRNLAKD